MQGGHDNIVRPAAFNRTSMMRIKNVLNHTWMAVWLFAATPLTAQKGVFGSLQYGNSRRVNGLEGSVNSYYSTRLINLSLGYQYEFKGRLLQGAAISLAYQNFNVFLKSRNLPYYDNSYFQQNVTLGNDGVELMLSGQRKLNDFTRFNLGFCGLLHFPGSARVESTNLNNPYYQDTSLYRFSSYQVQSAINYSTSGAKFSPGIYLGFDIRMGGRLNLQLGYKAYLSDFEGVSEVVQMTGNLRNGGRETLGYFQVYELPMRYFQIGLKYHMRRQSGG